MLCDINICIVVYMQKIIIFTNSFPSAKGQALGEEILKK
jgi:hypothetical protein